MLSLWHLTGGFPMTPIDIMFRHPLGGPNVWLMCDRLGRYWLAADRWSLNRISAEEG